MLCKILHCWFLFLLPHLPQSCETISYMTPTAHLEELCFCKRTRRVCLCILFHHVQGQTRKSFVLWTILPPICLQSVPFQSIFGGDSRTERSSKPFHCTICYHMPLARKPETKIHIITVFRDFGISTCEMLSHMNWFSYKGVASPNQREANDKL